jgi:uncharacterized cupin superfamily protein
MRNVASLSTAYIGKGVYLPGWRWSKDVGDHTGKNSERHIGYVISGSFGVSDMQGNKSTIKAGDAFELEPGSDAWVIGEEPCVALDFISKEKI